MSHHIIPSDDPQFRSCKKCGETKPLSEFPIKQSQRNGKSWHRGICARCLLDSKNAWRRNAAESRTPTVPNSKTCPGCNTTKPSHAFGISRRDTDGLQTYCKECRKLDRAANKEREARRVAEWQRANPERHYQKQRAWDKRNVEKVREINRLGENRRRTRKTEAGGAFTAKEWQELCERYDHQCVACGKRAKLTSDHVIPVSKGGSSNIENIQPLCQSCNSKKGDSVIDYRPLWEQKRAE
jgi:5-methylcytosine-specific restriction endonuclease McrA